MQRLTQAFVNTVKELDSMPGILKARRQELIAELESLVGVGEAVRLLLAAENDPQILLIQDVICDMSTTNAMPAIALLNVNLKGVQE